MIMVIQPHNDLTSSASHTRQKSTNTAVSSSVDSQATATPSSASAEKNVQLSAQAQTIERLEAKIVSSEGTDTSKIEQIKQQIADGSYEVNSNRIAEKMLSQEAFLAG
jgi:negative regulator of flagellin synthesis FlgM